MLYHGHSFTANPLSCTAALASLDLLLEESCTVARKSIEEAHAAFAKTIAGSDKVADVRQTGTIIAIELKTGSASYHSDLRDVAYRFFLERKIIMRPLGHIIYILPPYCIKNDELHYIYDNIREFLEKIL
jgi:adenosylmethionine---8-amino-7-oxononanoate aminotransferase